MKEGKKAAFSSTLRARKREEDGSEEEGGNKLMKIHKGKGWRKKRTKEKEGRGRGKKSYKICDKSTRRKDPERQSIIMKP